MEDSLLKEQRHTVEDDRSTKKARFRDGEGEDNPTGAMSFRDKVLQTERTREDSIAGDFDDFEVEEDDITICRGEGMPKISFSEKVKSELSKQWRLTVIVKLLGRPIGYRNLCNRLETMWNFVERFDVIDLENNYFLVKFRNGQDMQSVITGGPWVMLGHYLSVEAWHPEFDCTSDRIRFINAWIRLPRMPIHYYNKKVLRHIGAMVGKVIKIDYCTEAAERGKFARIAVELDLNKPLVSQFRLDGNVQFVEYECLPRICFECGKFGHVKESCPKLIKTTGTSNPISMAAADKVDRGNDEGSKEGNPSFGPWMMVGRKGKVGGSNSNFRNGQHSKSVKENNIPGSRFDVLNSEEVEILQEVNHSPNLLANNVDSTTIKAANNAIREPMSNRNPHAKNVQHAPDQRNASNAPRKALADVANIKAQLETKKFIVSKAQTSLDNNKHSVVNVTFNNQRQPVDNSERSNGQHYESDMMIDTNQLMEPDPPDDRHTDPANKENMTSSFYLENVGEVAPMDTMVIEGLDSSEGDVQSDDNMNGMDVVVD
ncbi:uncharacterized protein LOC126672849 [Mercurialis annua]|uniref:uncharacterized protein LOC126672849 n=1 Tax=Mercurialis annua TaxID=3986 RepID=UPI00215E5228|nr:uncharacterized protein LOC126672849 [Mercurialis annua]